VDNLRSLKENVIMGRLVPAGTVWSIEPTLESIPGCDEEARIQYAGGLPEDTGEESLAE
jgi:hypothetical protein